jgi:WD40 repeat protein/DNA-binding CsgD family transcriptional regulator
MLTPTAIDYLKTHQVSQVELDALDLALNGRPADRIADHLGITRVAVRKRLGSVYKKLEIEGSTHGKLALLREQLEAIAPIAPKFPQHCDWGDANYESQQFYGREAELAQMEAWIVQNRSRLLVLWGMGGIGKTSLTIELVKQVNQRFEKMWWRSLQDAPMFSDWAGELLTQFGEDLTDNLLGQLVKLLRDHACLLVLDNWESILESGSAIGRYRPGYEAYGELLRLVGEVPHQSTLLVTSREIPRQIVRLKGNQRVQTLELPGLSVAAVTAIFQNLEQSGGQFCRREDLCQNSDICAVIDDRALEELVNHCGGNPLTLKIVATLIQTVFHGDIAKFLQQGAIGGLRDIRSLINGQVDRLSKVEQDLMFWLTINRQIADFNDLLQDFALLDPMEAMEALQRLQQRSLLVSENREYKLLPVVQEVLVNRLIAAIAQELRSAYSLTPPEEAATSSILHDHALYKAQGDAKIRRFQSEMILEPLLQKLRRDYRGDVGIYDCLMKKIAQYRHLADLETGYSVGNLVNLLTRLKGVSLDNIDLSNLVIKQAFLRKVALHNANLSHSTCHHCAFTGILGSVFTTAFHPNQPWLATGDGDGRIVIWDLRSGEQKLTWQAHHNWVRSLVFTPGGDRLISASEDCTIKIWQAKNGDLVKILGQHRDWVREIALAPDGRMLASASRDGTIGLWDLEKGAICQLQGDRDFVRTVAFHPTKPWLASGGEDRMIRLWDVQQHHQIATFKGHKNLVQCITFSPDGKTLASAGWQDSVRLWNVDTQAMEHCFDETSFIRSLAYSSDGQYLAGGGDQRQSQVWDLTTHESLGKLNGHTQRIQAVSFKPNSHTLATASEDKTAILWDIPQIKNRQILRGYTYWVHGLALSSDGEMLASVGDDGLVRRWNPNTGEAKPVLTGHQGRLWATVFSPDGRWLVTSGDDPMVKLWMAKTGKLIRDLPHHDWVRALCFSPDGNILATSGTDNRILLWTPRLSDQPLDVLEGHSNWIRSLCFSNDGKILWSSGDDGVIRGWDIQSGRCFHTSVENSRVWSLAINAQFLASGSDNGQVRLWHPETGELLSQDFKAFASVRSIALHPTQPILAVGYVDQIIRLWNLKTQDYRELVGHEHWVRAVTFHPSQPILFSGSQDGSIRQWNWQTGECLGSMMPDRPYEGMNITQLQGIKPEQMAMLAALGAVEGGGG